MIAPDPFYARGDHLAIDLDGAHVVFTTRRGGASTGPYESMNLGRLTDGPRTGKILTLPVAVPGTGRP